MERSRSLHRRAPARRARLRSPPWLVAIVMTWPLAAGFGIARPHAELRRRTVRHLERRLGRAHADDESRAACTTPTSSTRTGRRSRSPRPTSARARSAIPAWLVTRNPWPRTTRSCWSRSAASVVFMWLLARRLTGDAAAACTAAVLFAFCPYVFSHTAHIQLLMTGGDSAVACSMFHRLVDAPSPARGVALGLALAAQALSCAYYGISRADHRLRHARSRVDAPPLALDRILDRDRVGRRGVDRASSCRSSFRS